MPCLLNVIELTLEVCPLSVFSHSPDSQSHSLIDASSEEDANQQKAKFSGLLESLGQASFDEVEKTIRLDANGDYSVGCV